MPERPAAAEPGPWSWLRGLGWNEGTTGSRTLSLTWRLRALAAFALLGCVGIFVLARSLALQPMLDPAAAGTAIGSDVVGFQLQGSLPPGVAEPPLDKARIVDAAWLNQPLTRWYSDTSNARRTIEAQVKTAALLSSSGWVSFVHADGLHSTRQVGARGWQGLGIVFWPLVAAALLLYLMASAVWLARPHQRNALYLLLAWSQAAQVVGLAVAALPGLSPAHGVLAQALPVIAIAELAAAALLVQTLGQHPRRLPQQRLWVAGVWLGVAAGASWILASGAVPGFFGMQALLLALALAAAGRAHQSWGAQRDPNALMLRRLVAVALVFGVLATLAVALAGGVAAAASGPGSAEGIAARASSALALVVPVAWHSLLLAMLLVTPLLARSRQLLREFAMLAGISAVATSLDLLFVALFALGPFTSLALAVFAALALYAGLRQWLLARLAGERALSVERLFERLYRVARQVQAEPRRYPQHLRELLREVFDPMEVAVQPVALSECRVQRAGATLLVPLARGPGDSQAADTALELRYAQRGRRVFTPDDARLADRILEQLRRAVAYDAAVERGRTEERVRIAQDLHDDIGARLLTLMYQAPTPELEDYIRHTLQDLKTLTRGLAVTEHRLSHAAAEWKADITQRLAAARATLDWRFLADHELTLTVVQWSALTRVLRELVSNALFHGHAAQVSVDLRLEQGTLTLKVADDGLGCAPEAWAHGLGLGGIRKRVRQLGGEVHWSENSTGGIVCEARLPGFGSTPCRGAVDADADKHTTSAPVSTP